MSTDLMPGRTGYRQLREWGYPQGKLRPVPPADKAFSVVHITGNPGNPIATASGELAWRINDPANQNSATFFVDRNGDIHQALSDPLRMAPWANGDLQRPDTRNPRIAAVVRDAVNPNERTLVAIECVGRPTDLPMTAKQEAACAQILARYHAKAGVPINRETVIGHYQINAVNRPNCPAIDKRVLDRIVALAAPKPTPQEDEMPTPDRAYVPQLWIAKPGGVDVREQADPRAPVVARIPEGTPVFTVGEDPKTGFRDGVVTIDGVRRLRFLDRDQMDDVGTGRDPLLDAAINAAIEARLEGKPAPMEDGDSKRIGLAAIHLANQDEAIAAAQAALSTANKENAAAMAALKG